MATRKAILERLVELTEALPEVTTAYSGHEKEAELLRRDIDRYLAALVYRGAKRIKIPKWDPMYEYTGKDEEGDA